MVFSPQNLSSIHPGFQGYHKKGKRGKEKRMPNNNNRVLVRRNARELSADEFQKILGQGKPQMTQLPSIPFQPDF
jgi:hypothetical protein